MINLKPKQPGNNDKLHFERIKFIHNQQLESNIDSDEQNSKSSSQLFSDSDINKKKIDYLSNNTSDDTVDINDDNKKNIICKCKTCTYLSHNIKKIK
jgi:hypothetical protein